MKNSKGNVIAVTQFESYLAHYLVEHSDQGSKLLEGIEDDSTIELSEEILPDISIGKNTKFQCKPS
tara:strand:+ start:331 stop:528 length:198 start_codon:yes stop_codon:yes gene_type:complete